VGATGAAGLAPRALRFVLEPSTRPPEESLGGEETWYASTCRQCAAGCGILVRVVNGRARKIEGNPLHPLNRGKLCARGQAGLQTLYNPDRLRNAVRQAGRGARASNLSNGTRLDALTDKISVWHGLRACCSSAD
jgi:anaerobic selenocysteine-containing dehydrogenase